MPVRLLLVVLLSAGLADQALSFPRLAPPTDPGGDPLPDRTLVRLGAARFRHPGPLQAVAYSPDGRLVAASSSDPPMVRVWDRTTGSLRYTWRLPGKVPPEQLVFGPDGTHLFAGRIAGRSAPWAVRDLKRQVTTDLGPESDDEITYQTMTPSGRYGLAVVRDRVVGWDFAANRQVGSFDRPDRRVAGVTGPELGWVAVSHNRTHYVATRLIDGKELWSVEGDWDAVLPNQPAAFTPDERRVAIRTAAGRVDVFETATGKAVARVTGPDDGAVAAMRFSPDGRTLAVTWKGKGTRLYDLPTGKERAQLPDTAGSPRDLAFSPDSKAVATVDPDGPHTLLFFDTTRGRPIDAVPGHTTPVIAVAISPDGSAVACVTAPGGQPALAVWDTATAQPRWVAADGRYSDVAFSQDGTILATGSRGLGNQVRVWDARTGRVTRRLDTDGDPVPSLVFDRDGRLVIAASARFRAWDPRTGQPRTELAIVPHGIDRVLVSPDGVRGIVATPGIYVCEFGVARTKEPDIPATKSLTGFALSPDGRLLATTDGTDSVRLWELLSKQEAATIRFPAPVTGVAFSPTGRTLAVATRRWLVLYDLPTRRIRVTLTPGPTPDTLVAFSADGRRLVSAGNQECTATVWDVADLRDPPPGESASLDASEFDACWAALADADPKAGYAAVWKLAACPDVLPRLARALEPAEPGGHRLARLIADLDHPRYAVRERATRELENLGEWVVDTLRKARQGKVSAEQAERLDGLLTKLAGSRPSPDRLRASRAVAALELMPGDRARSILEAVAKGPDTAPRTHEARAALARREGTIVTPKRP